MLELLSEDINIKVKKKPFRYIIINKVFKANFYRSLCKEFNGLLDKGLSEKYSKDKFWKFGHYDAYCCNIALDSAMADIFYSPQWCNFINNFFQHKLTNDVLVELHHHKVDSQSGYIHNDYDISSFSDRPLPNGMNPHRSDIDYRGRVEGAKHCVRSIAIIYYLNNKKWYNTFGGETALYGKDHETPAKTVAPISNKLVAFEVSPESFHNFKMNRMICRNSVVMWYHCSEKWAINRYSEKPK